MNKLIANIRMFAKNILTRSIQWVSYTFAQAHAQQHRWQHKLLTLYTFLGGEKDRTQIWEEKLYVSVFRCRLNIAYSIFSGYPEQPQSMKHTGIFIFNNSPLKIQKSSEIYWPSMLACELKTDTKSNRTSFIWTIFTILIALFEEIGWNSPLDTNERL